MVFFEVEGSAAAKLDTALLALRDRGGRFGDGGERSERAASTGAVVDGDVGVSQNMYMKPGSSELPNGRASSDISAEAICASTVSGMKSLICAVWEPVDLRDRREALPMDAFCDEASFEDCLGGTEADSRCTGRGWGREG